MSRILVIGRSGQLAWELRRCLLPLGEVYAVERPEIDLARPASLLPVLDRVQPDVIFNAAAYTAVDRAEAEPEIAHAVNAGAPALLAREAAARRALLVHYSTDYVFDGAKPQPYVESDAPAPLGVYGAAKAAGERAVEEAGGDHLILRTSWVYAARGANFLRTMLRLGAERERLRVVADQIGAPTWARFLAEASAQVLAQARRERSAGIFSSGLYHLSAAGETSWHGFACAIFAHARRMDPAIGLKVADVEPIATSDYPLPARRPANSRLSCEAVRARFGIEIPHWETALDLCLEELLACGAGADDGGTRAC
ncbi:MAG: dTDP-4-dehydrorhamnose reductase [Rhodocyclaceae bacterium]